MAESGEVGTHRPSQDPPGGSIAKASDAVLLWALTVVVGYLLVTLLDETVVAVAFVIAVGAVTVVLHHRYGFLGRRRYGQTPAARVLSVAALAAFLGLAFWRPWSDSLANDLAVIAALWVAVVALAWSTLRQRTPLHVVALGVTGLLMGVSALLFGVEGLRDDILLGGVTFLLLGVSILLLVVAALRESALLAIVSALLLGVVVLLMGVSALRADILLGRVAVLLMGFSLLLFGVEGLRDTTTLLGGFAGRLLGVSMLLLGVSALLLGVAVLRESRLLLGVSMLLLMVSVLVAGVAAMLDNALRDHILLGGFVFLLLGVSLLLNVVSNLPAGRQGLRESRWFAWWVSPRLPGRTGPNPENR